MTTAPFKTIATPTGKIELFESTDAAYPGVYIEVNEEQVALIEHDHSDNCPVIRVWEPGVSEDYVYKQKLAAVLMEREIVEKPISRVEGLLLDSLHLLTLREESGQLTEAEQQHYVKIVEFLQENETIIPFGLNI